MNYIKEINSFYDWLETNMLTDSAIVLWHALMHISNRAGWPDEFAVAVSTLSNKTGIKKDAIIRARLKLQQMGRVNFKSRPGQQSALYKIISFESFKPPQNATQPDSIGLNDSNHNTNHDANRAQTAIQTASIIKLNDTKENNGNSYDNPNPFRLFESEGFGTISGIIREKLGDYIDDYGERWVCEAMKASVIAGKRNLTYVNGILMRWKASGIDQPWTVPYQPVVQRQRERSYQRSTGTGSSKPVIPIAGGKPRGKRLSDDEMQAIVDKAAKWDKEG